MGCVSRIRIIHFRVEEYPFNTMPIREFHKMGSDRMGRKSETVTHPVIESRAGDRYSRRPRSEGRLRDLIPGMNDRIMPRTSP